MLLGEKIAVDSNDSSGTRVRRDNTSTRNRISTKSILKHEHKRKAKNPTVGVRFKDQCRTSRPFLSFFSKESRVWRLWNSAVYLAMTYEVWAFTFRLAFNNPSTATSTFAADVSSDAIFFLDVFIQILQSLDQALKTNDDPLMEKKLIAGILKSQLSKDLFQFSLCAASYYIATILTAERTLDDDFDSDGVHLEVTSFHWAWWVGTIPRFITRSLRLYSTYNSPILDFRSNMHFEDGKKITILIILSAHCFGCLYFFMSRLRSFDRRTWVSNLEETLNVYHRFEANTWEHYILALFKGFSAISGIEFTGYLANNLEEQLVGIAMILLQMYISALILGTIIHFLAIRDPLAQQAAEKLKDLREYIQLYQLPPDLEVRLVSGLEFQHRKMVLDNIDADIELSPSLQLKVMQSKYSTVLQRGRAKGQIFYECNERFLNEMLLGFNVMYLMAGQEIVKKGEISHEVLVLIDGAVEIIAENGESMSMISSSSPDLFPCVGEVAFFLNIMQPFTLRAYRQSDVRVVALSRESSEALFKKFPDQQEIISRNILRWHGLEPDGSSLVGLGSEEDSGAALHEELRVSIIRMREESFAKAIISTKSSELDGVKRLVFSGIECMKDYDGRTLLSHASVVGAYKIVEFLLEVKASVNEKNRWGQTPLDEALHARQHSTVQLLLQNRGVMGTDAMSATLIEVASLGNLETSLDGEQLSRIMKHSRIDPDVGDYDKRTALHLACANGFVKTAEILIKLKADVNIFDRWQGTPLSDAVTGGHIAVANMLRSKGAKMNSETGTTAFFDAAAKGNVVALRLLHSCDIVDLECKDYDNRNALHIAAAEGRLLAVSYLMSNSFSPHFVDRWQSTAMDDALKGQTVYHMYCAKLIQSMGGTASNPQDIEESQRALENVSIDDVRKRLMYLNRAGYNQMVPKQVAEEEIMASFERCLAHIPAIQIMKSKLESSELFCINTCALLKSVATKLSMLVKPICKLLDTHPFLRPKKLAVMTSDPPLDDSSGTTSIASLEHELSLLDNVPSIVSAFNTYSGSRKFLIKKLGDIIRLALEDGHIDESEQQQINLAWDELTSTGEDPYLQGMDALDSDEESELYSEVDNFMHEREFCEAHGIERNLFKIAKFQTSTLRISDIEAMYAKLCSIFSFCKGGGTDPSLLKSHVHDIELSISLKDLVAFFDLIGEETLQHTPRYEIQVMIEGARKFQQDKCVLSGNETLNPQKNSLPTRNEDSTQVKHHETQVLLRDLIAGSQSFRSAMLGLPVQETFGLLASKSKLLDIVSESVLQDLCSKGSLRTAGKGEVLFMSDDFPCKSIKSACRRDGNQHKSVWFVIISGSLSMQTNAADDSEVRSFGNGCMFGGATKLSGLPGVSCKIFCNSGCHVVELPVDGLSPLKQNHPHIAQRLAAEMVEATPEIMECAESRKQQNQPKQDAKGALHSFILQFMKKSNKILPETGQAQEQNGHAAGHMDLKSLVKLNSGMNDSEVTRYDPAKAHPKTDLSTSKPLLLTAAPGAQTSNVSMLDLYIIQSGFRCIFDVWQSFSCGDSVISRKLLHSMQDELGEVGNGIFTKLFLSAESHSYSSTFDLEAFHDTSATEFWFSWMRLILDKRVDEDSSVAQAQVRVDRQSLEVEPSLKDTGPGMTTKPLQDTKSTVMERSASMEHQTKSPSTFIFSERLRYYLMGGTSLRRLYLEKSLVLSSRYEDAYVNTTGSLSIALQNEDIPLFLSNLFPEYTHNLSSLYCNEFKQLFGKKSIRDSDRDYCTEITWAEIRQILRPVLSAEEQNIFVESVLSPNSKYFSYFWILLVAVLAYHFISVPLMLCFAADHFKMNDYIVICVFVPADIATLLCVAVRMNTAYKSIRHNLWVTTRIKILRKLGATTIIPALPLDWIAFALGNSYETCVWIRLSKLLLGFQFWGNGFNLRRQTSVLARVGYKILASFAVLHLCSCFWFFIAKKYPTLDPSRSLFVWFKVGYDLDDPRYVPDNPDDLNAHQYHMLSCDEQTASYCLPGENWYYYGMGLNDSLMAMYMLSFYLVSSRISNQALNGNVAPQNFLEVGMCILFVILNLTVFRIVIGDLSNIVMESDEGKLAIRARAMKIFSFISKNNVSSELADAIRVYCDNVSDNIAGARSSRVLRYLPRFLQNEVAQHVCRVYLDRVELFKGCSDHFKDLLCSTIKAKSFSQEEYLFRNGEVANDIYIIQSGSVELLVEAENTLTGEKVESVVSAGCATEQVAFFFQLQYVVSARASRDQGASCLQIGRERFMQLLKCLPEDEELVSANALNFVSFTKTGTSTISFLTDKDGEKTAVTSKSRFSEISAGRHGKSNRNIIVQIQNNRKILRMLLLFSAVKAGNLEMVKWCLKGDLVSVNDRDTNGRCLLHVAACEGRKDIVNFLLKSSADVNFRDHRGNTPLNDAVMRSHDEIALLIRQHVPGTFVMLSGYQAGSQMCEAAAIGNLEQVARLIENQVSLNSHDYDKRTALHLASCEGRIEVVKHLILLGADVTARDRFGNTALDDAIRHGHSNIKQLLYDAGVRVSGMSNVLMACAASAKGDPKSIELTKNLVDMGLDPKAGDYDGRTPLHLAACCGKLGLLEYFISTIRGAADSEFEDDSFNVVDRHGFTPLDDAYRHEHAAAIVVLESAGALRKGDPRLEKLMKSRQQKNKISRQATLQAAALQFLQTSPETSAWNLVETISIPALQELFDSLGAASRSIEELAQSVLPYVLKILENYVREVLPKEMTIVKTILLQKSLKSRGNQSNGVQSSAKLVAARKSAMLKGRSFSVKNLNMSIPMSSDMLEANMLELVSKIGEFLTKECVLAKEVLRIDLSQNQTMHFVSKGLFKEIKQLSLQIRKNAGTFKLVRKVIKEVTKLCLSMKLIPQDMGGDLDQVSSEDEDDNYFDNSPVSRISSV